MPHRTESAGRVWRVAVAGLAATLVGNGLARFAYTPLIPALIAAGWFAPADAVYLAAANLAGYFVGAAGARRLALAIGGTTALRVAMAATVVSLVACAWPLGFAWYLGWRFLAGVTGGVLMVLAAPAVLAGTPMHLRGRAGGLVFTGVGLGMAASGTIVPMLAREGLTLVWLTLAGAAALLTVYLWLVLPRDAPAAPAERGSGFRVNASIGLLLVAYGLDAFGFIPHTVFWVDFIARGLGEGLATGGAYWILFGLAAAAGPFLLGILADRIGFGPSYIVAMLVKAAGVALPLLSTAMPALIASTILVGALVAGTTSLCSGWIAERVRAAHHRQVWGWMTSAFALAQAGSGWGMSYLFARGASYPTLFLLGATALTLGAGCGVLSARLHRRPA